jgi:hypothetical protein
MEQRSSFSAQSVDECEMEAFLGLHLMSAAYHGQRRATDELWSLVHGQPVFRATMSEMRFKQLKRAFRTDDPLRRNPQDKLAPVRFVFDDFLAKLMRFINPPHLATIDEQLIEYHGRVAFRQYIPSKPGKFGMKVFWLCDAETRYVINGLVYIGKNTLPEGSSQEGILFSEAITLHLCQCLKGTSANITGDNYFTSSSLVDNLAKLGLTYVGTLRSNRRDVPPAARSIKGRQKGDVKFFYTAGHFLCSFWDKKRQPVLLLDSFAKVGRVSAGNQKPDSVEFYNQTKSGVDVVDKLVRGVSTRRKCRRWPYTFTMNLMDIAICNAAYIYGEVHQQDQRSTKTRHLSFLINAGYQMLDKELCRRATTAGASQPQAKLALQQLGYLPSVCIPAAPSGSTTLSLVKPQRCFVCPRGEDKKTRIGCSSCQRPMCASHRSSKCSQCA